MDPQEPPTTPSPAEPVPPLLPPAQKETLEAMDMDETKLYEVHRHPFGLIVVYVLALLALATSVVLTTLLASTLFPNAGAVQRGAYVTTFLGLFAIAIVIGLAVYTYIYRQSKLLITNKNLTKIIQQGLFHREVAELSMANVEDVRATTSGIFATLFGFGELEVETAAEDENFRFRLCPNPNFYGKIVLDARQEYLDQDGRTGRPGR